MANNHTRICIHNLRSFGQKSFGQSFSTLLVDEMSVGQMFFDQMMGLHFFVSINLHSLPSIILPIDIQILYPSLIKQVWNIFTNTFNKLDRFITLHFIFPVYWNSQAYYKLCVNCFTRISLRVCTSWTSLVM